MAKDKQAKPEEAKQAPEREPTLGEMQAIKARIDARVAIEKAEQELEALIEKYPFLVDKIVERYTAPKDAE